MLKEYVPKSSVLIHPKVVAIFAISLLWGDGRASRPLAAAVEEIAEEEDGVRVE